jgi:hypothetical protein
MRAIQRIDWARKNKTNLVVNTPRQYSALKNVQPEETLGETD